MNSANCNTFSYAADSARARWAAHVDGGAEGLVCVLGSETAPADVRSALKASFERLGYGRDACTFMALTAGEETLDLADAYTLIESLDPLVLVATDSGATRALAQIYRTSISPEKPLRLLGRDVLAFTDFAADLTTPAGKQRVWTALKHLSR
ncbi:MAG: hypothetical protein IKF96_04695 [Eggerthellaceae bacterium]|nr:hypothetical protein [Eggerthellaceae bacterium]